MNGAGNQAIRGFLRVKNEKGNTAFHEAAIGGHHQVIEVLLERDRPPQSEIELQNIISDTSDTDPHSIVNDAGDTDLQNIINDGGEITDAGEADPHNIISDAAETDLPNITNVVGETALFKAVEEGHQKIVAELLPLTLPQQYWRTDGQTLVHCAVYSRRKEVPKKLIAAKPDLLKQADYLRRTPLHYAACLKGISHIAKIILEKDTSSCYTVDNNHQSALHIAVKEGNIDLVREILKYAKDCIVIGDNEGRNAFHLVIENAVQIFDKTRRRIKTLMFLVISKRLINEADNRGKTPLDIALDNMDTDERLFEGIIWLLEINGAWTPPKETHDTSKNSLMTEKSMWKAQIISVNAVLIAVAAFQTAFTLQKDHKEPMLYVVFMQFTVICDALALTNHFDTSLTALWTALISLLLAFGGRIFVATAPTHTIATTIVLNMVIIVPISIIIMILCSKKYIFRDDKSYLWTLLILLVADYIWIYV
ncbi:uncharacterized protein LOC131079426 [Cryptomeria japonica]|uniref:uncharacterized protein LOC131079426 n=1 Tax=Cryptomeria japonica TaxID=3369 RepID=UPI0027DAB2A1|nr:uncharacterized protein LOC131079426 [Cryptomeria japonica]